MESHTAAHPRKNSRTPLIVGIAIAVVLGGAAAGLAYMGISGQRVYIEKATISAPEIPLSATVSDTLRAVMVSPGDSIAPGTVVAQVGTELIKSTLGGLVVSTNTNIGAQIAADTPVVVMIDPSALRVVGQLDEDKGLVDIKVGDAATFTVDAYGGRTFTGVVSEISPTSQTSDVAFSISDKRETRSFDVKVAYDAGKYPQFRNGMSARIWVYKK
jgi:multidrug resistance efflux pump